MRMEVENVVIHPDYNKLVVHDADIALLNVKQPSTNICVQEKVVDLKKTFKPFKLQIWPACFPSEEDDYADLEDSLVKGICKEHKLSLNSYLSKVRILSFVRLPKNMDGLEVSS